MSFLVILLISGIYEKTSIIIENFKLIYHARELFFDSAHVRKRGI